MNRNILHEFDLVVYPCDIYIAVDCSEDFLREKFNEPFAPMDDKLVAQVCTVSHGVLVRFRSLSCMTVQIIAHESTHAALYVFDYMGCKLDYDNQEPLAFLIDCIANFCDRVKKSSQPYSIVLSYAGMREACKILKEKYENLSATAGKD